MARSLEEVARIFQASLELIQSGQVALDGILTRYPDLIEELRPGLEAAEWLIDRKAGLNPSPEFVRFSRYRLVNAIQ